MSGASRMVLLQAVVLVVSLIVSFSYTAEAQALLQAGMDAPPFSLKDIEGREVSLSGYSDRKAVVVVFWSTWSANSRKALKRFEEFYRKYRARGIEVIGINADRQVLSDKDIEEIKGFVGGLDITFPVLLDRGLRTFHSYNVIALPSTIVITGGKIAYELPGFPLVGTEEMFDYLLVLAGESPRRKVEPGYRPPHRAVADTNLARQFMRKRMYAMARPLLRKAIDRAPEYMLPYVELARVYEEEGRGGEAEAVLRKALSVKPGNVVVMTELGHLLSKEGKTKEALKVLREAVKDDSYTPAHYYLAYALFRDGRMKEALEAFERAISLNPYDTRAYMLRAEAYEAAGMSKEAAADYRKALELLLKLR